MTYRAKACKVCKTVQCVCDDLELIRVETRYNRRKEERKWQQRTRKILVGAADPLDWED